MRKVIAIVVKDGEILSFATNEHTEPCRREGYPTGVGYELCEGCQYSNHAEYKALKDIDARGAVLHLFGHTYACKPCTRFIQASEVTLQIHA